MANFQVIDGYGSIITIESSVINGANRQVVTAAITLGNTSISGTAGASIIGQLPAGVAVLGSVAALQGTNPWITLNTGSIATVSTGSIATINMGSVITVWQDSSVFAVQKGNWNTSIVNTVPSSVMVSASLFGQLPGGVAVLGSVAALQGTSPWNIAGSVAGFQVGTWSPSAIGYLKRNDTLASTLGADGSYGEATRDSAGRAVIKPFVADDSATFQFTTSVVSTSVTLIQSSAIGKRVYVTDIAIANTGAATTLVTFQGGDTSILGYTIAPTTGGSNLPGLAIPWKTTPSQDLAFKASTGTSILYVTVRGYQAP